MAFAATDFAVRVAFADLVNAVGLKKNEAALRELPQIADNDSAIDAALVCSRVLLAIAYADGDIAVANMVKAAAAEAYRNGERAGLCGIFGKIAAEQVVAGRPDVGAAYAAAAICKRQHCVTTELSKAFTLMLAA